MGQADDKLYHVVVPGTCVLYVLAATPHGYQALESLMHENASCFLFYTSAENESCAVTKLI